MPQALAPFTATGYFVYNPAYNAPLTAAELDLFKRLQAGDPTLQQQYKQKYGERGCIMVDPDFVGCAWLNEWQKDQDYWNVRYLNQLASNEEMARLAQDVLTPGVGYPYSIFHLNSMTQMEKDGTLDAYLSSFRDPNLAGYLAAALGRNFVGAPQTPTDLTIGLQPPTWNPTSVGQSLPNASAPVQTPYEPPAISGPLPPAPTSTGISGPAAVQPPIVTGAAPSPSTSQTIPTGTATTQPPTVTAVPNPSVAPMPTPTSLLTSQPPNVWLLVGAGVLVLAVVIYAARK